MNSKVFIIYKNWISVHERMAVLKPFMYVTGYRLGMVQTGFYSDVVEC